jgi:hypothetical protein
MIGFLFKELVFVLPVMVLVLLFVRLKLIPLRYISYIICIGLVCIVVYNQFFNGLLYMNNKEFNKVHKIVNPYHGLFPLQIISNEDSYIINSWQHGIRFKEIPFQENVWLRGDELIYTHDNCGFGEMCVYEYIYGSEHPLNFP